METLAGRYEYDWLIIATGCDIHPSATEALDLLDRAADLSAHVDIDAARPPGLFGLMGALGDPDVKQGMGIVLELTRGMAQLKPS